MCLNFRVFNFHLSALQCSATCRGGIREREVFCIRPRFNETSETMETILVDGREDYEMVDDAICEDEGLPRPDNVTACNDHINCPFRYKVGNWSTVSSPLLCNYYEVQ